MIMNHTGTIFILLIGTLRHDFVKQIIRAHIRRRERIILSQKRNVIANLALVTVPGVVNQNCAVVVPSEAALVLLH